MGSEVWADADRPFFRRSGSPVGVIRSASKRGGMLSCVSGRDRPSTLLSPLLSTSFCSAGKIQSVRDRPTGVPRGAGGENRTRTISLGICAVSASTWPDLRFGVPASDRERPLVTGLMAQRHGVQPWGHFVLMLVITGY
jgi:hypothetical protein